MLTCLNYYFFHYDNAKREQVIHLTIFHSSRNRCFHSSNLMIDLVNPGLPHERNSLLDLPTRQVVEISQQVVNLPTKRSAMRKAAAPSEPCGFNSD